MGGAGSFSKGRKGPLGEQRFSSLVSDDSTDTVGSAHPAGPQGLTSLMRLTERPQVWAWGGEVCVHFPRFLVSISSTLPGVMQDPCGAQPPELGLAQVTFPCQVESSHLVPAVTQGRHMTTNGTTTLGQLQVTLGCRGHQCGCCPLGLVSGGP